MKIILIVFMVLSSFAHAQTVVETVDGLKGTGYMGLGDLSKISYLPIVVQENAIPENFNWDDIEGVLPPIRNQGSCGSCWAFAIVGAMESASAVQNLESVLNLSEQHMVSCDRESYGCNGGFMSSADFIVRNGVTDEQSFPYTGRNSRCKSGLKIKAKASKYYLIDKPNVDKIKTAIINNGPVFVTVMAGGSGWSGKTDKITSCRKRGTTNHMVILIGWDKSGWIMRNSWEDSWGDKGYSKIGFNCDLIGQEAGFVDMIKQELQ